MKLPNQTRGPVSLTRIDYSPRLSEETEAFAAVITINGLKCGVSNAGHGGSSRIDSREVEAAVDAYVKTLPAEASEYSPEPRAITGDYLIATMIGDAITEKNNAKYIAKGFTHAVVGCWGMTMYIKGAPTAADIAEVQRKSSGREPKVVELTKKAVA